MQGVGFRVEAKREAEKLRLGGFVRNERDGTVYVEIEGEEETVNKFLAWCARGPAGSHVTHIETQKLPVRGFQSFTIERANH